ncbi:MAG: hypothetical protein JSU63_18190 [Phycisphaerales bacterium]|nr:MAG: hypothetical protein JSU63_18190 [Phycisphaerales bacterium]
MKSRAKASTALLACLGIVVCATTVWAYGGVAAHIAVKDVNGNPVPGASVLYSSTGDLDAADRAVVTGSGTWLAKCANGKLLLEIQYGAKGYATLDLLLPEQLDAWVIVTLDGDGAQASVVSEKEWLFGQPTPPKAQAVQDDSQMAQAETVTVLSDAKAPRPVEIVQRGPAQPGIGVPRAECDDAIYDNGTYDYVNALWAERSLDGVVDRWIVDDVTFTTNVNITDFHWWGNEPTTFNWTGQLADFIIVADAGGAPGATVVEILSMPATRVDTGDVMFGDPVWLYTIQGFDIPLTAGTYWIGMRPVQSIPSGTGQYDKGWWTTAAPNGTAGIYVDYGLGWEVGSIYFQGVDYDVAFCVTGYMGEPPYGCCCDDFTSIDEDCVLMTDCPAESRFTSETLCADVDPLCGQITGACCNMATGDCQVVTPGECTDPDEEYQGHDTTCDPNPCPCVLQCPGGALDEPEACGEDTNGGCNDYPPAFTAISCGETFCGSLWSDTALRDLDWYEITVADFTRLTWTVESETPANALILQDPVGDCDVYDLVVLADGYSDCDKAIVTADVMPGTYIVFAGAGDFVDFPCADDTEYVGTLTCETIDPFYCPTGWSDCPGPDDWITNVTFNTINNTTGDECATDSYGDYTALSTTVARGSTHTLFVTFDSGSYTECVRAWIDWDQSWTFDAGEEYDIGSGASTTVSAAITVPVGAELGETTMRITEKYYSCAGPCDFGSYGETEDYTVVVEQAPQFGACCDGMTCTVLSPTDCATAGGVYKGDGSTCAPVNPCVGACCYPDGSCADVAGDTGCVGGTYQGDGTLCATTDCPQPGGDCGNPLAVGPLPFTDTNTNCGLGEAYDTTCLGSYDGGDDIIYELTIPPGGAGVKITMDPDVTTWTGILLDDSCPPDDTCIWSSTSSSAALHTSSCMELAEGTYYIMIDTYPSPQCIPTFDLTVETCTVCEVECPVGGIAEAEACGADTNGGCNEDPAMFEDINLDDVICGTAWGDAGTRDIDWYRFTTGENLDLTLTVTGEFGDVGVVAGFMQTTMIGSADCAYFTGYISPVGFGAECDDIIVTSGCVPAGDYVAIIMPDDFYDLPCDSNNDYTLTVSGTPCTLPLGACCLGDGSCVADVNVSTCQGQDGIFQGEGTGCDPNLCPQPIGEDCDKAILITSLPFASAHNNDESTPDGPDGTCDKYYPTSTGLMQNDVWWQWTAPMDCFATATIESGYDSIIAVRADDCVTELYCDDSGGTGDPDSLSFSAVNGTTYFFQIGDTGSYEGGGDGLFTLDCTAGTGACCFDDGSCVEVTGGDCATAGGTYSGDGTTCTPNDCPQPVPGDTCALPIAVTLPAELPYSDIGQTTVGRGDDYDDTCLGSYDGGDDILYELDVTAGVAVEITLDPKTTTWTGISLDELCPADSDCIDTSTTSSASPHGLDCVFLDPGMYYIMISTYPSPQTIPDFDLTITECTVPTGACCVLGDCVATNFDTECAGLGGEWFEGEDCSTYVCPGPEYCESGANYTADSIAEEVSISDLTNNTAGVCATYSDFTGMSASLTVDSSYTLDVWVGDCDGGSYYSKYTKAYIDWNGDFDFDDAGEEVLNSGGTSSGNPELVTGLVTVPSGAIIGDTRMRVVVRESGSDSSTQPCGNFSYGETEDYTVSISAKVGDPRGDWDDDDGDTVPNICDICEGHDDLSDADGDEVPDGCDACEGYDDSLDADGDGVPDDCDICEGYDDNQDADGDGTPDGCDGCPEDPFKIAPGICGCGIPDTDTDNDGCPDCVDECPMNDLWCTEPACGCDSTEYDNEDDDGDGFVNCFDTCAGVDDAEFGPCDDAIPTVSTWGLVVLALLLLTFGKVFFNRRRAVS